MKRVEAVFRPERLATVSAHLEAAGFVGFTISDVRGHGQSPEKKGEWRGQSYELHVTHKLSLVVIIEDEEEEALVEAIGRGAWTGKVGDGLITVSDLRAVHQVRNHGPQPTGAAEGK